MEVESGLFSQQVSVVLVSVVPFIVVIVIRSAVARHSLKF